MKRLRVSSKQLALISRTQVKSNFKLGERGLIFFISKCFYLAMIFILRVNVRYEEHFNSALKRIWFIFLYNVVCNTIVPVSFCR